jgi:hypothetical protein
VIYLGWVPILSHFFPQTTTTIPTNFSESRQKPKTPLIFSKVLKPHCRQAARSIKPGKELGKMNAFAPMSLGTDSAPLFQVIKSKLQLLCLAIFIEKGRLFLFPS